jgi:hypothetical protein
MAKAQKAPEAKRALASKAQDTEVETAERPNNAPPQPPDTEAEADARTQAPDASPRVYRNSQIIEHDLFKLNVATMRKNISFTDVPEYAQIEHVHIFHTVDSNGNRQTSCTSVGGHHHDIEVLPAVNGGVPHIRVSGPKKWVRVKRKGRVSVPVSAPDEPGTEHDQKGDFHTHKVTYLGSEKIQLRVANMEFAKLEATVQARTNPAPVEGVI